jgi:hypothetical protein
MGIRARLFAVLFFGLLQAGCQDIGDQPQGFSTIEDPAERWAAYNIQNYSIDQQRSCFCPNGGLRAKLTIAGNQITGITDVATGDTVPQNQWGGYSTVDQLFSLINSAQHAAVLRTHYDPAYGFPDSVYIDWNVQVADDEILYLTRNLKRTLE